jgi:anthranilate phosphoribosyltransferase
MGIGHESQSGTPDSHLPAWLLVVERCLNQHGICFMFAAAALHVAGVAATLLEGAELARDRITGERAVAKPDAMVRETNLSR